MLIYNQFHFHSQSNRDQSRRNYLNHNMRISTGFWLLLMLEAAAPAVNNINIVFWVDPVQKDIGSDVAATLKEIEALHLEARIQDSMVVIDPDEDEPSQEQAMKTFCDIISYSGVSVILDFTYEPWHEGLAFVQSHRIPYIRIGSMLKPFLDMFTAFAEEKQMSEVIMLVQSEQDKKEALMEIIRGLPYRTLVINALESSKEELSKRLLALRPTPSYYAIFAKGTNMNTIFDRLYAGGVFLRTPEWHFVYLDPRDRVFKFKKQVEMSNKFTLNPRAICKSLKMKDAYCQSGFNFQRALMLDLFRALIDIRQSDTLWLSPLHLECNGTGEAAPDPANDFDILDHLQVTDFMNYHLESESETNMFMDESLAPAITFRINVSINLYSTEHEAVTDLAVFQNGELKKLNETLSPAKRFFRIGTAEALPWSFYRRDPQTNELILDDDGKPMWEGFCIDLIETLAERLDFDYEIVPPTKGTFGDRDPVTKEWDGLVGDLVSGEIDFAVAALKMYSEREEYIDFIAPYFEQTGISIVMRKPVRETSLFKFMTVLRIEVWMSIVGALVSTAVMIWLLEKYSPYSAMNNPEAYPYPCREFTLRESFWFSLTSFTPQGGGEVPKAMSSRILVAAYWLFVVLMLATFTANLAAFLTVERMQTPVQSLDQLARQSRINYTVVNESDTHQYFINMDFAERTLYRMWKELALNASRDFNKFRVWDYPIKEQYGRILLAINNSNPVKSVEEGFRKVNEHESADFAFIHDSSEIKYEITKNCNLTEVGEVFAEQPYAIAVQQGSHLVDSIAFVLLELQKDRYFEDLRAKHWNRSRSRCPLSEEEEGITLDSLGGVFIATLCGLGFALVSLMFEIWYYRSKAAKEAAQEAAREAEKVMQVKPIEALAVPTEIWHSASLEKTTPPPSFEAATFHGLKLPTSFSLASRFQEQADRLNRRITARTTFNDKTKEGIPALDDLPGYLE